MMNKVVHFEIPFDDGDRAKKFYQEVFSWKLLDVPGMDYTMAYTMEVDEQNMPKESGGINGGMYKRDETSAKSPVLVISVPSVDEHVKKVEAMGGKVTRPKTAIGDFGLYAQVADTEGNIIGIWEDVKKA